VSAWRAAPQEMGRADHAGDRSPRGRACADVRQLDDKGVVNDTPGAPSGSRPRQASWLGPPHAAALFRSGVGRATFRCRMRILPTLLLLLATGCGSPSSSSSSSSGGFSTVPPIPPTVCNGHAELCGRAYDAVTFPGTHDAYATHEGQFLAADQTFAMARQLADGVRVLHLEIQPDSGVPSLCHASCAIGHQTLVDGLREILGFVEAHPAELVTLLMETTGVTRDDVADAMKTSGLLPYLHAQALDAPWPTVGAMLDKGERVVAILAADGGASHPDLLDRWSFTWETPWDNESLDDFRRCDADRGQMSNGIYVVDTYLEDAPIQSAMNAARVNGNPFLVDRLRLCHDKTKRVPNFAMVNYYEVGDLFVAVDMLNGFTPAPPFDDADFPPGMDGGADGGDAGP